MHDGDWLVDGGLGAFPNSWTDSSNEHLAEFIFGMSARLQAVARKFKTISLMFGGDLNVQLPAFTDVSGGLSSFCSRRPFTDRQLMVMEFQQKHKLKALNTFQMSDGAVGDCWTHYNHLHKTRTQIDLICVTENISGSANVLADWELRAG